MSRQIATFILGETILGVDIIMVKEIYRNMNITPVPDATPHLRGLMNLRGRVVTIIDLNICLGRESSDSIKDNRLLVLKTQDEISALKYRGDFETADVGEDIVGFLIDRMDDVVTIEDEEVLPPPANIDKKEEELIEGVIKRGDNLVMLLDISAVLERVMSAASNVEEV